MPRHANLLGHHTTTCLGMTMGLNPYRGPAMAPAPLPAAAIPGIIPDTGPPPASSVAAVQPLPSSGAVDEANVAGAAEDQAAGTDSPPTAVDPPRAPDAPDPMTLLTRVPSPMAAAPARGVTLLTPDTAAGVAAASVCPSDTAVGMVLPTNQAAVTPTCWTPLKINGVPMKPSTAFRRFCTGTGNALNRAVPIDDGSPRPSRKQPRQDPRKLDAAGVAVAA